MVYRQLVCVLRICGMMRYTSLFHRVCDDIRICFFPVDAIDDSVIGHCRPSVEYTFNLLGGATDGCGLATNYWQSTAWVCRRM